MATHSSTLAWKIPWLEEPGGLQSMGSLRVGHDWATSLSLSTFMHWRRKWQPTPVFLPGESQGREPRGLPSMGSHRVGHDWSDLAAAAAAWDVMDPPLASTCQVWCSLLCLNLPWLSTTVSMTDHSLPAALPVLPSRRASPWWPCLMSHCHPHPNLALRLDTARGGSSRLPRATLDYLWSVSAQQGALTVKHINQGMTPHDGFALQLNQSQTSYTWPLCDLHLPLGPPPTPSHCWYQISVPF